MADSKPAAKPVSQATASLHEELRLRLRFGGGKKVRLRRPPKWLHPDAAKRRYQKAIETAVERIRGIARAVLLPALPRLEAQAARTSGRDSGGKFKRDSWVDDLDGLMANVRNQSESQGPDELTITNSIAADISQWNAAQWRQVVKATVGVDVFASEPWLKDNLRSWARENAALITSLEDDGIRDVQVWTQRGLRNGWRHEDIAKNIEERFDVTRARAKLIARDQTSKLNGDLTEKRQRQAGVNEYIWRTSNDERVRGRPDGKYPNARPSHWKSEGEKYSWDKPPEQGHPGQDFQCRCTAEPILDPLLEALK